MKQKGELEALVLQVFKRIFIAFILFASLFSVCFAEGKIDSKLVSKIELYLNNIKYFKANFIQDDTATSQLCEGKFYLSRPGKLRVDYLNPFEASLYSYNRTTTYYDKELDEVSTIRTASTPLQFLLRKNISFKDKSLSIVDLTEDDEQITISLKEKGKENSGTLMLKFTKNPIVLSSLKLINGTGQEIEMTLFNISNKPIEDSMFVFKKLTKNKNN